MLRLSAATIYPGPELSREISKVVNHAGHGSPDSADVPRAGFWALPAQSRVLCVLDLRVPEPRADSTIVDRPVETPTAEFPISTVANSNPDRPSSNNPSTVGFPLASGSLCGSPRDS